MSTGLSTKLPLSLDPDDGLALNKTYKDVARQNFINLLLTIPGERVMIPEFGIGVKKYLFESDNGLLRSELKSNIIQQVAKFLPYIEVLKINFLSSSQDETMDNNLLIMKIIYRITPLGTIDEIDINRDDDDIVVV